MKTMKNEANAYVIKLVGLAETVKEVSKSKNGRYELCGGLGTWDKKIHIYRGIENLANDLGVENISKRDDIFEFRYLGYTFFQIVR